ncbi:MAG TPA: Sua5/YciO/YrdC/YwlC family protein [Bacillales bacterium]|nr:Sua5/YciO/YrdC/YwlC family protein [Bacillales bacterium]
MVKKQELKKVYQIIKEGGLVLLKADIGYGLFGHSDESIRKMYEIKGRPSSNPCITIGNLDVLKDVATIKDERLFTWISTIIKETTIAVINSINKDSKLLRSLPDYVLEQSTNNGTVATFLNTGEFLDELVSRAFQDDFLIIGSSGNVSSFGNNYRFSDVQPEILKGVDYYLDMGDAKYKNGPKLATTMVNLTNFTYKRKGVNFELIDSSLQGLLKTI